MKTGGDVTHRLYFLLLLLVFGELRGQGPLKMEDVYTVMEQIFHQHVEKKEMTPEILQNGFKSYIEEFDPGHIYLLQQEVQPYLQPTQADLQRFLIQYQQHDLSFFQGLNRTIQASIERARGYRAAWQKNPSLIPSQKSSEGLAVGGFAATTEELQRRMGADYMRFLQMEQQQYGKSLPRNSPAGIKLYDQRMREDEEASYSPMDQGGRLRSMQEQENTTALHILKALSHGLDAHTNVLNSQEAYEMKIRLDKQFLGIGVTLEKKEGKVVIGTLLKNGPAEKSGLLQPGDEIVEVGGQSTEGGSLNEVLTQLRSGEEKQVTLQVKRPPAGKKIEATISRAPIEIDNGRVEVASEKFGNGIIAVVKLHSFYRGHNGVTSEQDLKKAIYALKQQNLRGLVLDLRDNLGGYLTEAVKVAGLFISGGVIVISKYSNGEAEIYRDVDGKAAYSGPLLILTSKETASAAEIVTQALQDYGIALVVGDEHTYGKGTIQAQTVTGENNKGKNSFLKVTVGKYYTVSGKTPQLWGVRADIVAPSLLMDEAIGEEYLEYTEKADQIEPAYEDKLADINPLFRGWYLHYYTPKLQHQVTHWRQMLPALRENSQGRIAKNEEYQAMIKEAEDPAERISAKDAFFLQGLRKNGDPQLKEAMNVLKDLIFLDSQGHAAAVKRG